VYKTCEKQVFFVGKLPFLPHLLWKTCGKLWDFVGKILGKICHFCGKPVENLYLLGENLWENL
jgi:hypothetical protein